jgi:DNA-directed RNA polymerase subunit alpha
LNYYKQLSKRIPPSVNALLNLAVLHEDRGEFEKAEICIEMVLSSHPNHAKASLFLKDIRSSRYMVYDEEKEKRRDRQNKILEIPISDFELSVPSRNCLKKMNIVTLGDLLRTTEAELLSYINFGETSLVEIKKILDSKNLRWGWHWKKRPQASHPIRRRIRRHVLKYCKKYRRTGVIGSCTPGAGAAGRKTLYVTGQQDRTGTAGCQKLLALPVLNEIKDKLASFGLGLRKID